MLWAGDDEVLCSERKIENKIVEKKTIEKIQICMFLVLLFLFLPQNGARCAPSGSLGWKKAKTLPNAKNSHRRLSQKYVLESLPD